MSSLRFSAGGWVYWTVLARDKNRVALLIAVVSVLISSCVINLGKTGTAAPILRPYSGAPVTVEIAEAELIISNDTEDVVYHVVFPAEILPRIEWAPCLAPTRCDPGQEIALGDQKVYHLDSVGDEDTEELVVYWWKLRKNAEGEYDLPEIQEVRVPVG